MTNRQSGLRLAAWLYFVAAALALSATVVRYARGGEIRWFVAVAGIFLIGMGVNMWKQSQRAAAQDESKGSPEQRE